MDRRHLIGATLASAGALGISACQDGAQATPTHRALDFKKPEDNLYALMKLMGDISGKRTYYFQPGRVFAHQSGKLPLHLMNYSGATVRELRKIDDRTYETRLFGWQLFQDPETNEVIDNWVNPVTRTSHTVEHFVFPETRLEISAAGRKRPENTSRESVWYDKELILPWQILGDHIWAPYDQFGRYVNRKGEQRYENAIHTYQGRLPDLTNPDVTSAPSTIASQSQSPYYMWMGFDQMDGHLISTSLGTKFSSLNLYPETFRAVMEERFPGDIDKSFSWTDDA